MIKIIVRLPNWLGDVVMSLGFIEKLHETFPQATIDIIVKKGLEPIVQKNPHVHNIFSFSKSAYPGLRGVWKFGRQLARKDKYDLFFSLPNSLSSAVMAFASRAKSRIGYAEQGRSIFLTHPYKKPIDLHRVEEYVKLIEYYQKCKIITPINIAIGRPQVQSGEEYIILNINAEAASRRLPQAKAVEIALHLSKTFDIPVKLIGGPGDIEHVQRTYDYLAGNLQIFNIAGKTSLEELITIITRAKLVVSTDSGPAHIASAAGVPLVVLFGAGNEKNTGPYHRTTSQVVRLDKYPCEPCVKNKCKIATNPPCLMYMDVNQIMFAARRIIRDINLAGT